MFIARTRTWLLASLIILALAACGGGALAAEDAPANTATEAESTEAEAPQEEVAEAEPAKAANGDAAQVTFWSHLAGNPEEIAVVEQMIADFNDMQGDYEVVLEAFPQASYNDSVAGGLPCIVDLDAPTVPNFA